MIQHSSRFCSKRHILPWLASFFLLAAVPAFARPPTVVDVAQAPALPGAQPISSRDRVYTADQTSNTVSVIDPSTNTVLGTLPLGNARPDDLLGALYNKQINTHGLGFSPDGSLLAVINVTSNGVSIIETATNKVLGTVYLRRAPHEGFFTPDGRELIGVDSVGVEAEGLTPGAKYQVYAVKLDGTRQLIAELTADPKGKGAVDPLLKFFAAGFVRVEVRIV